MCLAQSHKPQVALHGQLSDVHRQRSQEAYRDTGNTDNFNSTDIVVPDQIPMDQGAQPIQGGQGGLPGPQQQQGGQPAQL